MKKLITIIAFTFLSAISVSAADNTAAQTEPVMSESLNKISINHASAELLAERLNGVGDKKAQAIVSYRDDHGPFQSLEQLLDVKGIGPSIIEKNRDFLSL
ncbi:ComEA family DNA-binding protein [Neiella holothuriorum]|nr:helix-hairpin-helix domain-containing protein [Neiella holothuriorum]